MKTILTAAFVAIVSITSAFAQWQPSGPIKLQVGFRAGGGLDTLARLLAEELSAEFGWTVIPENIVGGGGAVLARAVKDAEADGLTVGIGLTSTFAYTMLSARNSGYQLDDFEFLATIAGSQAAVVGKADSGWNNMTDVIAAAKSGKEISFGAQTQHLTDAARYIGKVNGVKFNVVSSFTGGKAVLDAIVADDIDIGWVGGIQKQGIESGELVNLLSAEDQPLAVSPDAQTLKDVGVDFFLGSTTIAYAPKGISNDAKNALTDAIATVVHKPGSKLNDFITTVFSHKLQIGDKVRPYVDQELANAKTLIESMSK